MLNLCPRCKRFHRGDEAKCPFCGRRVSRAKAALLGVAVVLTGADCTRGEPQQPTRSNQSTKPSEQAALPDAGSPTVEPQQVTPVPPKADPGRFIPVPPDGVPNLEQDAPVPVQKKKSK